MVQIWVSVDWAWVRRQAEAVASPTPVAAACAPSNFPGFLATVKSAFAAGRARTKDGPQEGCRHDRD